MRPSRWVFTLVSFLAFPSAARCQEEPAAFLDSARADLNGDGDVEAVEAQTFQLLLANLRSPSLLVRIVQLFTEGDRQGNIDLSEIFLHPTPGTSKAPAGGIEALLVGCSVFKRGDSNNDGTVDISDAVFLLDWLFQGSGEPPPILDAGDADDNGAHELTDALRILNMFQGGPLPPHPYPNPGLDPTPDDFDPECTPHYVEFNPFTAVLDFTGDGVEDPLYVVPSNRIELYPLDSAIDKKTFATVTFPSGENSDYQNPKELTRIAAADNGVVYALTNYERFYAFKDTTGDGIRDVTKSFLLPSKPIDAVLIFTDGGQAVVTLHDVGGSAVLYLWSDNDADGYVDGLVENELAVDFTFSPKGLAVDRDSGRMFVSGFDGNESLILVLLDEDADRIAETPVPYLYASDGVPVTADELEFRDIHFNPEARALLILEKVVAEDLTWRMAVICAKELPLDPTDPPTEPDSVNVFADPVAESTYVYSRTKNTTTMIVWVSDSFFATQEFEGSIATCSASPALLIARSSAARRSAFNPAWAICTVVFTGTTTRAITQNMNFADWDWADGPKGAHQIYNLWGSDQRACGVSATPGRIRVDSVLPGGVGTGFVDWGLATPVGGTDLRTRLITDWDSTPFVSYCCGGGGARSSTYVYSNGVAITPIVAEGGLAIPPVNTLAFNGGRWAEGTGLCGWDPVFGMPNGTKTSAGGWAGAFQGSGAGFWAPFPFTFTFWQQNQVNRLGGGRSYSEHAYQKTFIEVDCRPTP